MANRTQYHLLRRTVHLNKEMYPIVIGTLLGDGSLVETFSKNNLRLQIEHCNAQKSYVFWKYEALKPLVLTPPQYTLRTQSWRFRTISHPEFTAIGRLFYRGRTKIVPKEITSLLTPITLAVWFMDDGARYANGAPFLNTQCFERSEVTHLQRSLAERFSIHDTSLHRDKNGWRLYIKTASADRFRSIVRPFMLPALKYKIDTP